MDTNKHRSRIDVNLRITFFFLITLIRKKLVNNQHLNKKVVFNVLIKSPTTIVKKCSVTSFLDKIGRIKSNNSE